MPDHSLDWIRTSISLPDSLSLPLTLPLSLSLNMEFEKKVKESLLDKNVEEKLLVSSADCDATPLLFTFVPTLRRLPTPVHWVDTSQFLVRIPEEACEHSPDTVSRLPADTLLPGPCGRREGAPRTPPGPSEVSGGPAACGPQGMRPGDVFKARCVFIVDSEGEDEATGTPGDPGCSGVVVGTAARPRSLPLTSAVPSDGVRPKVWGPRAPASGAPRDAPPPGPAQPYKTTSSYKAFAAIPTNTLLLEQKALDEPVKTEHVSKDSALGLPVEHAPDSPSRSPKTMLGSETIQTPTTVPRAAGRETKYANLSSASSAVSESQLTKPGVIRPVPVRSRIFLKTEEEVYEPNPFSQYLGFRGGFSSEQQ
ncbi:muscular LMNA-interacting protein isoform X2 [Perognathus longimembris pacificus]|uniref:muscular LMNA-interacting protein isoform X2 n=1 Tax=Perognathus longimembris pacificus TaxID=214514 RepID=UPI00201920ED|nr:muscular LMNA-interacting protein isoform X2 [Perognathus longimembris pacificus]